MSYVIPIAEAAKAGPCTAGGKACALSNMMNAGISIPDGICITTEAYRDYMSETGLGNSIITHLHRKQFDDMRWEEIWDIALRIRNRFLLTPLPEPLKNKLVPDIARTFAGKTVAVRSSAPEEDTGDSSFAGLHESFVNVSGVDDILQMVLLVWASLWSDRALLYRQEIGLDVEQSAMAVVIQEMVAGERSGIAFTRNPADENQGVIEAVYGLNQGLVDGTIEPDRWILDRDSMQVLQHREAVRSYAVRPDASGTKVTNLKDREKKQPPLNNTEVLSVFNEALQVEQLFGKPQDTEWTLQDNSLYLLQARPITRLESESDSDQRGWYLSLSRSHDNLKVLQARIENKHIPAMESEAAAWADKDLAPLSDQKLADEIHYRQQRYAYWEGIYKDDFIPFAHGMRLFGQFYNDKVKPEDPYEFMELLAGADMLGKQRNRQMNTLADMLRCNPEFADGLREDGGVPETNMFTRKLNAFLEEFGDTTWGNVRLVQERKDLVLLLLKMAEHPAKTKDLSSGNVAERTRRFLDSFDRDTFELASSLLDIGRASYLLRDNDNVYLGKLQGQFIAAVRAGCVRIGKRVTSKVDLDLPVVEVLKALTSPGYIPESRQKEKAGKRQERTISRQMKARQIVGQPASRGIGIGAARVVTGPESLFEFNTGEILVCDAIDPNMTFIVPLAAGIVERRGGMLIHGAIIAREYGIPCVTGVPDATIAIRSGEKVSVDGHLGIVIVG